MKKFAKLLAMVLAVSMVLTMFVGAFEYKDTITEEKAKAINTVYEAGVMMGNEKGEFMGKNSLTRQEMAKIMFALTNKEQDADEYYGIYASVAFADYAAIPAWSKAFIGYAAANKVIVGNEKGEANAKDTLTYVQAAIMLLRSLELEATPEGEETYKVGDESYKAFEGPQWKENAVLAAYKANLFANLDIADYTAVISREDVAVMIYNAIAGDATKAAAAAKYELAKPVTGVVIGTKEVEIEGEKFEALDILNLSDIVLVGDNDANTIIGREINAIVENNKAIAMEIAKPVFEGTVTLSDIAVKDIDEEDKNTVWSLLVGETVVAEDLAAIDARYIAKNSVKYAAISGGLKSLLEGEQKKNGNQSISLIVNETSLFVSYAPYEIHDWSKALVAEEFKDGAWTGIYKYNNTYVVDKALADLDDCVIAAQLIDNQIYIVGFPQEYKVADLTVTYSAKDGKYAISLNGETLVNKTNKSDTDLWKMNLTGDKGTVYVYNGEIVRYVAEKVDTPKTEYTFVFGTFVDATISVVANPAEDAKDDEKFINTITYYFTTLAGATLELTDEVKTDAANIVTSVDLPKGLQCIISDGKNDTTEAVDIGSKTLVTAMDAEKINGVKFADYEEVYFVDATKAEIELKDIEVKEDEKYAGYYVATIDGVRVNKTNVVYVYTFGADKGEDSAQVAVVVYDPEGKYELKY